MENPGSDPNGAEKRAKALKSIEHSAAFFATFYALARFAPHPGARAAGRFMTGLRQRGAPGTSQNNLVPDPSFGFNFAPVPIGYSDPSLFGLPKDFFLPGGASTFIPKPVDSLGLGTREARNADEIRRQQQISASARAARIIVSGESDNTLEALAAGRGGLSRAGVVFATGGAGFGDLVQAAANELERRRQGIAPPPGEPSRINAIIAQGQPTVPARIMAQPPDPDPADDPNVIALLALALFAATNPPDP